MAIFPAPFRFTRYDIPLALEGVVNRARALRDSDGVYFQEMPQLRGEMCRDMYGDLPYGLFVITDATIVGEAGYIFASDNTPIAEQNAGFLRQKRFPRHRYEEVVGRQVADEVVVDEAVSLLSKCHSIFWHWIMDSLPKVLVAEESGFQGSYIVPSLSDVPVASESLQLLGISAHRIIHADSRDYRIRRLHIPTYFCGYNAHHNLAFTRMFRDVVRRSVREHCGVAHQTRAKRRIFVARRTASKIRRVRNEDEVRTLLQRYDFETIYFEDYSLKEQITIASEAEIMIAPHGSGATHALFMDEGSLLIELFPHKRRKSSDCFESLSVIGKNRYYPLESELPDDGDIDVNCSALHTLLERESRVMNVRGEVLAGNVAERIGAHELSL